MNPKIKPAQLVAFQYHYVVKTGANNVGTRMAWSSLDSRGRRITVRYILLASVFECARSIHDQNHLKRNFLRHEALDF
jgi:hypothetical protein